MAFRLSPGYPAADEVRRAGMEQIERALQEIADDKLSAGETVHQIRKRLKKMRALARLVRPVLGDSYKAENVFFRDTGRALAPYRDADAQLETVTILRNHYADETGAEAALDTLAERLADARESILANHPPVTEAIADAESALRQGRKRMAGWPLDKLVFADLRKGMKKTYRRARRRLSDAEKEPSATNFHEWRKRQKYHGAHMKLLRDAWPELIGARYDENSDLTDALGNEHDLAILRGKLLNEDGISLSDSHKQSLLSMIDRRRIDCRRTALSLGSRVLAERASPLGKRLHRYWDVAQRDATGGFRQELTDTGS